MNLFAKSNILACEFKRILISSQFIFSVIGYILVTLLTLLDEGRDFQPGVTSLLYVYTIIRYLDFHILYIFFAGIPSSLLFCLDWDHHFIRYIVIRSTKRSYAVSKVIICFASASCLVIISNFILLSILGLWFPLYNNISDILPPAYLSWPSNIGTLVYLLVKILCEAACAGFLSVTAMLLSTIFINAFVALAAPLATYYIINTISYYLNLPVSIHIGSLSRGVVEIAQNPILSLLYTLLIFIIATTVSGQLFTKNCIRRIKNG